MELINNFEYQRSRLHPWAWADNIFSDEELENIISICELQKLEYGKINKKTEDNEIEVDIEYRNSLINFNFPTEKNYWIFERLNESIIKINNLFFNYDLIGYDHFQYTVYEKNGYYKTHMDLELTERSPSAYTFFSRKISLSLLLNDDYEGGNLQFQWQGEDVASVEAVKGRCYFFPSYMMHSVSPVISGTRKCLVTWIMGPHFK